MGEKSKYNIKFDDPADLENLAVSSDRHSWRFMELCTARAGQAKSCGRRGDRLSSWNTIIGISGGGVPHGHDRQRVVGGVATDLSSWNTIVGISSVKMSSFTANEEDPNYVSCFGWWRVISQIFSVSRKLYIFSTACEQGEQMKSFNRGQWFLVCICVELPSQLPLCMTLALNSNSLLWWSTDMAVKVSVPNSFQVIYIL